MQERHAVALFAIITVVGIGACVSPETAVVDDAGGDPAEPGDTEPVGQQRNGHRRTRGHGRQRRG